MDKITVTNFRCFQEKQTARLAPLTLLVGENSTGKTSLMAMIRSLWDVAFSSRITDFKKDPYDLGSFDDIAHHRGGRAGRAASFEAGFEIGPRAPKNKKGPVEHIDKPFQFEATFTKRGTVPIPTTLRLTQNGLWVETILQDEFWTISFGTPNGEWSSEDSSKLLEPIEEDYSAVFTSLFILQFLQMHYREGKIKLKSLKGLKSPTDSDMEQINKFAHTHLFSPINNPKKHPFASAPVRSKPHRTYDPADTSRDPGGDYIPMYLASVFFQKTKKWSALKDALDRFGQDSGLFDEISVKPLGGKDSGPFQVQIRKAGNRAKGPNRNLIDVGYGVSQVLPVITELLREDTPPMYLLQQPEVHLHPSAQAALGTLFCQVATIDQQLIVETHSDFLLDRVRMEIRDGTSPLKPEDVSILFFERNDLDVRIHSLELDNNGNILNVPETYRRFFLTETQRSLGL